MRRLDRRKIRFRPLAERANKVSADRDMIDPDRPPRPQILERYGERLEHAASCIAEARRSGSSVILSFGAHTIKNGLGPVLIRLIQEGHVTHLATNGAGIIHDWEIAFLGATSEEVRTNLADGRFGNWSETGLYLNLALAVGAFRGLGYGEAIGALIQEDSLPIPSQDELGKGVAAGATPGNETKASAAFALQRVLRQYPMPPGRFRVEHPWRRFSVQAAAHRCGIALSGHPMFGHDIIYTHPLNSGAAVGICAERDFLGFADAVAGLSGGVYLSVGSAVMSPMVFEKALSMARNIALPQGRPLADFAIQVVDLKKSAWDWGHGEPPESHPDYYLRYMKTFSRAAARELSYLVMDNRDYLTGLYHFLKAKPPTTKDT